MLYFQAKHFKIHYSANMTGNKEYQKRTTIAKGEKFYSKLFFFILELPYQMHTRHLGFDTSHSESSFMKATRFAGVVFILLPNFVFLLITSLSICLI